MRFARGAAPESDKPDHPQANASEEPRDGTQLNSREVGRSSGSGQSEADRSANANPRSEPAEKKDETMEPPGQVPSEEDPQGGTTVPRSTSSSGSQGDSPLSKKPRTEEAVVGVVEDVSGRLDYSALSTAKELTHWDDSGFPTDEAAVAIEVGLKLCDEFGIYSVHPKSVAEGREKVDTKLEKKGRAGVLKYRLVGREFAWLEERDDLFAPGSTSLTSRAADFLSLKDDDPNDPMVVAVGDETNAYYQAPEDQEIYCDPPREWLAARAKAGLSIDVVWKLEKQLPGRRVSSRKWTDHAAGDMKGCGLDQNPSCPKFYR